ncbi:hypothetical protein F4802DRAFT_598934 [Xylaria palmicola]|nr:hypothetical protein F4802DRAFT_598934 [Xylaria palmicola]
MLLVFGSEVACVAAEDPDATADPRGNPDELRPELVGPAEPDELDSGNGPDERAVGALLDGVAMGPVAEMGCVPELGVSIGTEDEFVPGARVAVTLGIEFVPVVNDALPDIPEDDSMRLVSVFVDEIDISGMVGLPLKLVVTAETEVLFDMPDENGPLPIADRDWMTAEPVPGTELVSNVDPPEIEGWLVFADTELDGDRDAPLDAETETPEVRAGLVTTMLPEVAPVLMDGTEFVIAVEFRVLKGALAEKEPDGSSEELIVVVPDADGAVPLDDSSAVELVMVKGGMPEKETTVPFDTGTPVVIVVPTIVVGIAVATVVVAMVVSRVVSMVAVNVVPVTVPELCTEFGGAVELPIWVEPVMGYGVELDDCTGMAEALPLALVRLTPVENSEAGEVPEDTGDVTVAIDVIDPPLGTSVGLVPDELATGSEDILKRDPVELMPVVSKPEVNEGGKVLVFALDVMVMLN